MKVIWTYINLSFKGLFSIKVLYQVYVSEFQFCNLQNHCPKSLQTFHLALAVLFSNLSFQFSNLSLQMFHLILHLRFYFPISVSNFPIFQLVSPDVSSHPALAVQFSNNSLSVFRESKDESEPALAQILFHFHFLWHSTRFVNMYCSWTECLEPSQYWRLQLQFDTSRSCATLCDNQKQVVLFPY